MKSIHTAPSSDPEILPETHIRFAADRGDLRLLHWPGDGLLLRRRARDVADDEFGTEDFEAFCRQLSSAMMDSHGVGIAATQVEQAPGGAPWRVIVLKFADEQVGIFCNPFIERTRGSKLEHEGCLSFASVSEVVAAPEFVHFNFRNMRGAPGQLVLQDRAARALCHEVDHLDGRLLIDRMTPLKRQMFVGAVRKRYQRLAQAPGPQRSGPLHSPQAG